MHRFFYVENNTGYHASLSEKDAEIRFHKSQQTQFRGSYKRTRREYLLNHLTFHELKCEKALLHILRATVTHSLQLCLKGQK